MPQCPLSRDTPSIPGVLCRDTRSVPRRPYAEVPAPCRGIPLVTGARFHVQEFQVKLQFTISPNVGVSRAGSALPR